MGLDIIITGAFRLFGFILNFWKSKEDKMKWMNDAAQKLYEKGRISAKQLAELEADRAKFLDSKLTAIEIEIKNETNVDRPSEAPTDKGLMHHALPKEGPKIVQVKGLRMNEKKKWRFQTPNGMPFAAGVHYTASAESIEDNTDAISILRYLVNNGLCCVVVDQDGVGYVPENFDPFKEWGSNYGRSFWRGSDSVSRFIMGLEIVNAGKLVKFNNKYYAWFDLDYDPKTNKPVGVKKGKSHHPNPRISGARDNIQAGAYDPFTPEQEQFIIDINREIKARNPYFDVEWVVGHDEVAKPKGRKSDPGASLSMTMPEMRRALKEIL